MGEDVGKNESLIEMTSRWMILNSQIFKKFSINKQSKNIQHASYLFYKIMSKHHRLWVGSRCVLLISCALQYRKCRSCILCFGLVLCFLLYIIILLFLSPQSSFNISLSLSSFYFRVIINFISTFCFRILLPCFYLQFLFHFPVNQTTWFLYFLLYFLLLVYSFLSCRTNNPLSFLYITWIFFFLHFYSCLLPSHVFEFHVSISCFAPTPKPIVFHMYCLISCRSHFTCIFKHHANLEACPCVCVGGGGALMIVKEKSCLETRCAG